MLRREARHSLENYLLKGSWRAAGPVEGDRWGPFADLVGRIGEPATRVWLALLSYRDVVYGVCHPGRAGVLRWDARWFAGERDLTPGAVTVALRKLRRLKLVHDVGWRYKVVRGERRLVYQRRVFGAVTDRSGSWEVLLPRCARQALDGYRWGGRRAGAGRPRHHLNTHPKCAPPGEIKWCRGTREDALPVRNQVVPQIIASKILDPRGLTSGPSYTAPPRAAPPPGGLRMESTAAALTPEDAIADALRGSRGEARDYPPGAEGVPVEPWRAVGWGPDGRRLTLPDGRPLELCVPAARPISPDAFDDEGAVVSRMERAFDGAVDAVFGGRRANTRTPVAELAVLASRSPRVRFSSPQLREAALAMAAQLSNVGVSPEAWFIFVATSWRRRAGAGDKRLSARAARVPARYALSEEMFVKSVGHLRHVAGDTCQARPMTTPAQLALYERYARMMWALRVAQPKGEEGIKAVVAAHFPGGSWGELVAQARAEIERDQAVLDRWVAQGVWLW